MITKVKFEGFKLLRDVELALGRFNVIVGENGTGKSSILEGLHYLLQMTSGHSHSLMDRIEWAMRDVGGPSALCSKPASNRLCLGVATETVGLRVVYENIAGSGRASWTLDPAPPGSTANSGHDGYVFLREDVRSLRLDSVALLRLSATQLAEDHYSEDQSPRIEHDGAGLASVLQELQNARDGRFEKIEADLQKVVPAARRIRTTRAKIVRREKIKITIDGQETWSDQEKTYIGAGIEVEWGNVGWVPARHLSEGTLLALGLCTVLHHRPPTLILLDDLDKALHPKAQRELVQLLRTILASNEKLQVLATTHSPFVVDEFAPEDVLVVASLDGNSSQVRRLSEHPKWNDKKPYLETGEFWSAVGERWAAEKRA
jgi:predicted ATPase